MLYIPQPTKYSASIVGVDPGTNTLGSCVLDVDIATLEITGIYTRTYVGEYLTKSESVVRLHGDRIARLMALQHELSYLFTQVQPLFIGCESPFINVRRPQAYGALVQAVEAVRSAVIAYNTCAQFRLVEPLLVKTAVGAKTSADKEAVWQAVLNIPEIMKHLGSFHPDEHSVDSIAVAYYILKQIRTNPLY